MAGWCSGPRCTQGSRSGRHAQGFRSFSYQNTGPGRVLAPSCNGGCRPSFYATHFIGQPGKSNPPYLARDQTYGNSFGDRDRISISERNCWYRARPLVTRPASLSGDRGSTAIVTSIGDESNDSILEMVVKQTVETIAGRPDQTDQRQTQSLRSFCLTGVTFFC